MPKTGAPLPAPLAKAARRFERWRQQRHTRRIPEDLWTLAASLAARYGVSRTSRELRVQYYDLKDRVASLEGASGEGARPSFVEIVPVASASAAECVVEFESAAGAKMRIQAKGASAPDLAELSRVFLEHER